MKILHHIIIQFLGPCDFSDAENTDGIEESRQIYLNFSVKVELHGICDFKQPFSDFPV